MVTILSGTNNFTLKQELKRLVSAFVGGHGDMALERLDGSEVEYERLTEALQSLPFLAARKMVVLQSPGSNKKFSENVEKLLADLPETTDLVIVEPKLDKRSAYYKFLKKQKGFQEFGELDEAGLARWLVGLAREKGATLAPADANYLVARVGSNQQTLANEIEKLSLYQSTINRNVIDELTAAAPQSTIFQLLEASFAGNTALALRLYGEQRALKVEPQQIIAMLAWQLHVLALVKTAGSSSGGGRGGNDGSGGKTPDEIARDAKLSPYVVRKTAGIARRISLAETKRLVRDLLVIDERLKRESLNADDALMHYLMTIAT